MLGEDWHLGRLADSGLVILFEYAQIADSLPDGWGMLRMDRWFRKQARAGLFAQLARRAPVRAATVNAISRAILARRDRF